MRPLYGYWGVFFLRGVGNEVVLCVSTLMLVARDCLCRKLRLF